MQFEKPKVTIDLEEYQHLKDRVNGIDADQYVVAAKKVIAALLTHNGNSRAISALLASQGVMFSVSVGNTSMHLSSPIGVHYESISISIIDDTKK